jgi:hypothetical protein
MRPIPDAQGRTGPWHLEQRRQHPPQQHRLGVEGLVELEPGAVLFVVELEPGLHDAVQQRRRVGSALERLPVDLEEQPLVRPPRGIGQPLPHASHDLRCRERRVPVELCERVPLALLD